MPLIAAIREKGTPPDTSVLQGTFDTGAQAALCNSIAKELGFNLECGRLDVSVHPFTGGALSLSHETLLKVYRLCWRPSSMWPTDHNPRILCHP